MMLPPIDAMLRSCPDAANSNPSAMTGKPRRTSGCAATSLIRASAPMRSPPSGNASILAMSGNPLMSSRRSGSCARSFIRPIRSVPPAMKASWGSCAWAAIAFVGSSALESAKGCMVSPPQGAGDIGGANAFQCEPVADALVDDAAQFLGQRDPGVARGQPRQLGEPFGNFTGAGEQLVCRHDFVDSAPFLGGLAIEFLAGETEVTAAHAADHLLP